MKKRCLVAGLLAFVMILSGCGSQSTTSETESNISSETASVEETVSSETESNIEETVSSETASVEETVSSETESNIEETVSSETASVEATESKSAVSSGVSDNESAVSSEEEKEPEIEFETVNPGDKIITDFAEIKLDKNVYESKSVTVPQWIQDATGIPSDNQWSTKNEKTAIYITGSIKNTGKSEYDLYHKISIRATFDDKYEYSGNSAEIKLGTSGYGLYEVYDYELDEYGPSIEPFETKYFTLCVTVPDELINSYKTCTFDFGFDDNFSDYRGSMEKCKNKYRINIEK